MHFLPRPQHEKDSNSDKTWTTHVKNCPKYVHFYPRILHLSSNRRKQNLALYFQFTTPARKLTHTTKFKHFWMQKDMNFGNARILRHFGPEKHQNQPQKDMNFRNAIILWHFGPEKCQNQPQKIHEFQQCHNSLLPCARELPNPTTDDMNFGKLHSLTPAKMPAK